MRYRMILRCSLVLMLLQVLAVVPSLAQSPPVINPPMNDTDRFWDARFGAPGLENNASVTAVAPAPNGDIYVAGTFTHIGGIPAHGLARWDGTAWRALGSGIGSSEGFSAFITSLAVVGTDLYVGGRFTTIDGIAAQDIARWDGSTWSDLNGGLRFTYPDGTVGFSFVSAMTVHNQEVYVGGQFNLIGGVAVNHLARWNGRTWTALGTPDQAVRALAIQGDNLYISGGFTTIDGIAAAHIAHWDGSQWSALGAGIDTEATSLAIDGGMVYVTAPLLTTAGTRAVKQVARWDGATWTGLGDGIVAGTASTLGIYHDQLYVGGLFSPTDGMPMTGVAMWNGTRWSQQGFESLGAMTDLHSGTNGIYAGGALVDSAGIGQYGLIHIDADAQVELIGGIATQPAFVGAMTVHNGALYSAGRVEQVDGQRGSNLLRWQDSGWMKLVPPPNMLIEDIVFDRADRLYASGYSYGSGPNNLHGVAQWDGRTWSGLGGGVTDEQAVVYTLAVSATDLYMGGSFTQVDNQLIQGVARWNGTAWTGLGIQRFSGKVNAIAFFNGALYAGGSFEMDAGSGTISHLARWDGTRWSQVAFLPLPVSSMMVTERGLYISTAAPSMSRIYRWDETQLTQIGGDIIGFISAVYEDNGTIYIGGRFSAVGRVEVANIARWDGTIWHALGSGVDGEVYSLTGDARNLYVGGQFSSAGAKAASSFSIWHKPADPVIARGAAIASIVVRALLTAVKHIALER